MPFGFILLPVRMSAIQRNAKIKAYTYTQAYIHTQQHRPATDVSSRADLPKIFRENRCNILKYNSHTVRKLLEQNA